MSRALVGVALVLLLACGAVQPVPRCAPHDEECRDRHMHPDLPDEAGPKSRLLDGEDTNNYWHDQGKAFIRQKLEAKPNTNRAKNVIMFLGDGMGLTTLAATRSVLGGEHESLSFETFPYVGLSKTYSVDKIVPDSACTATAYLCGVKGIEGTIGVNGNVERDDCVAMQDPANHVFSIAKWAMDAGKSAGVVTTTRITHASPAGVYAHIADRDWENDSEVAATCGDNSGVEDIALQLIHGEVGSKLKLMMGGGRSHFVDSGLYANGYRSDGRNLIDEYRAQSERNAYVETYDELMAVDLAQADRLFGCFQDNHLLYHLETNETTNQPTLEEMTRKAIEYLSANEEGYFIFIEGGRIDLAHHDNMARIALDETVEFSKAIRAARDITSEEDTLIVVTADHSHAFSFAGYPDRGADIFGGPPSTPDDQLPHTILAYANGPSYEKFYDAERGVRKDPTLTVVGQAHDEFPAGLPLEWETHGGDDVPVFASGPWAQLFSGVYEQNAVPHMLGYAACLGDGQTKCSAT